MLEESNRLLNEQIGKISLQYAIDNKFFGPIYHGTSEGNRDLINKDGFKIFYGDARSGNTANGYELSNYSGGIPAPVHHLGFGIYFTTNKSIAKKYNGGSGSKLSTYFSNVPKLETINFGSPNTMMKWWLQNGYNYE
jgi:hypothetical protein